MAFHTLKQEIGSIAEVILITDDEAAYEKARMGGQFNTMACARKPSAIVFAKTAQDVVGAVKWAVKSGVKVCSIATECRKWCVST